MVLTNSAKREAINWTINAKLHSILTFPCVAVTKPLKCPFLLHNAKWLRLKATPGKGVCANSDLDITRLESWHSIRFAIDAVVVVEEKEYGDGEKNCFTQDQFYDPSSQKTFTVQCLSNGRTIAEIIIIKGWNALPLNPGPREEARKEGEEDEKEEGDEPLKSMNFLFYDPFLLQCLCACQRKYRTAVRTGGRSNSSSTSENPLNCEGWVWVIILFVVDVMSGYHYQSSSSSPLSAGWN